MRFILADDHELTRRGMRALLEARSGWKVVVEAADGISAIKAIESDRPDIAIIDLSLPGLHGLEVLREGRRRSPLTRYIVLSMHGEDALVAKAFRNGADAYVLKGARADDLLDAVLEVKAGRQFVSAGLAHVDLAGGESAATSDRLEALTPREREILQLTAEGNTSVAVAEMLFISPRTVEKHRENLMAKLGLRNQTEVVRFAIERGLLSTGRNTDSGRRT
jgi:DNA-binding NarL/FixJ family response regulator